MQLERAKGTRDLTPEEEILKSHLLDTLKKTFELYGYNPLQTPLFERLETFKLKYAGGEEILKEVFTLKDQGQRDLALRFDLTVPFARYIGMNQNIKMPFKRYQIGEVFRDGPIKFGRYRQFTQCDIDIVGAKSLLAELELLTLAQETFKQLKLDTTLKINNIKILKALMRKTGIKEENEGSIILTLDKLEKIGKEGVEQELNQKGLEQEKIQELLSILLSKGSSQQKILTLKKILGENEGLQELEFLLKKIPNLVFEPSLARGLNYYTGTIYEGHLKNSEIKSSICSGGRYDHLISEMLKINRNFPTLGLSFGLDVILDAIKLQHKEEQKTVTKVFVIPIQTENEALKLCHELRKAGINTDMDLLTRGISKNLDYAKYFKIPYVIILGTDEVKKKKFTLKNMNTGKEKLFTLKNLIKELK